MRPDVAVVGGGPAGCYVGKLLADQGFEVTIIEEHAKVGHPKCCAGIVGAEGIRELGIKPGKWVLNELGGARLYSPSGDSVTINRGRVEAFVIDRQQFDRELAIGAARAGATFLMGTQCIGLERGTTLRLRGRGREANLKPRLIIGADGPNSLVAREAGLLKASEYIFGAQVEVMAEVDSPIAELYFGRDLAPGFFAWMVRAGEICRVGLCSSKKGSTRMLMKFVEKHPIASRKIRSNQTLQLMAGLIPKPLTREICADKIMLVGDAAGHVKPLTGGGIYFGLSGSRLAAEVATRSLEKGEPSAKVLSEYKSLVQKRLGAEIDLGMRAHRVFEKMSDEELSSALKLLEKPEVKNLVLDHADFDHHGKFIKAMIKRGPILLKAIGMRKFIRYLRYLV